MGHCPTDNRVVKAWAERQGEARRGQYEEKGSICNTFNNKYIFKSIFKTLKNIMLETWLGEITRRYEFLCQRKMCPQREKVLSLRRGITLCNQFFL